MSHLLWWNAQSDCAQVHLITNKNTNINITAGKEILNPYTAERRDVSENTPPEAQEISQGRGFCTPRPERLPKGEARGQSRGPREISRAEGGVFSDTSRLEAVYGHSFIIIRELLILLLDNCFIHQNESLLLFAFHKWLK